MQDKIHTAIVATLMFFSGIGLGGALTIAWTAAECSAQQEQTP